LQYGGEVEEKEYKEYWRRERFYKRVLYMVVDTSDGTISRAR
jgi:hypothetical protein